MSGEPDATIKAAGVSFRDSFAGKPVKLDWSGNDSISFVSERARVYSGTGFYREDFAFTLSLPDVGLRCESAPSGPNVPSTRFGCWSTQGGVEDFSFWIAPGEDCPARDTAYLKTLTAPECWRGVLRTENREARLFHGYTKGTGTPAGWVSWIGSDGELLLASRDSGVGFGPTVNLFHGPAEVAAPMKRKLVLSTVAVALWRDTVLSD